MSSIGGLFEGRSNRGLRWLALHRDPIGLRGLFSAVAFWSAILLPVVYLPLLIAGIETVDGLVLFLTLFGLHVLALAGGRRRHVDAE